jgi:hypothetical protein
MEKSRREIDHDPIDGPLIAAVDERPLDAMRAFLNRGLREPDQNRLRQRPGRNIDFDLNRQGLDPNQRISGKLGEHREAICEIRARAAVFSFWRQRDGDARRGQAGVIEFVGQAVPAVARLDINMRQARPAKPELRESAVQSRARDRRHDLRHWRAKAPPVAPGNFF